MNLDPASYPDTNGRLWAFARRYFLRHHFRFFYPLACIMLVIAALSAAAGIVGFFCEWPWYPAGFLVCIPAASLFGVTYHHMDGIARYFASDALSDGNCTTSDIVAFYESYCAE